MDGCDAADAMSIPLNRRRAILMKTSPWAVLHASLLTLLVGCGSTRPSSLVLERLYFGRSSPHGEVTPQAFQQFVDDVVTPLFPDGLTQYEAKGQWKGRNGDVVREASVVIDIVCPDTPDSHSSIGKIVAEYRKRFEQESVLVIESHPAVSF
jgi:hypothetical protein